MRVVLLLPLFTAALSAQIGGGGMGGGGGAIAARAPVPAVTPSVGQYDPFTVTFQAQASGALNVNYVQDLTTFQAVFTAPGGSVVRGDGVTVTTMTILGHVLTKDNGYIHTWAVHAALCCPGTWTYTTTLDNGATTYTSATIPTAPSGSVIVTSSSNDGFLRISGRRLIRERDGTVPLLLGAAQAWSNNDGWSIGGAGVAGADIDGGVGVSSGPSTLYFGGMGSANLRIFRTLVGGAANPANDLSSFNADSAGHNQYDFASGLKNDAVLQIMHTNGVHYVRTVEGCNSSSFATSGASYTAITNGIRYALARYGAYMDVTEICNEKDTISQAFITAIRAVILSYDPYAHPITTSFSPGNAITAGLTGLDITSPHEYVSTSGSSFYASAEGVINTDTANYNIPSLTGESGNFYPIQNSQDNPYRWLGLCAIEFVQGAGCMVWDMSYDHPVDFGAGKITNMYIGTSVRTTASHMSPFWDSINPTTLPVSITLGGTGSILCRLAASSSGLPDMIGFCADTTGFAASHPGTSTVQVSIPGSSMSLQWFDPVTNTILGTASPSSGTQTLTIPAFVGTALIRACVHTNAGCPL